MSINNNNNQKDDVKYYRIKLYNHISVRIHKYNDDFVILLNNFINTYGEDNITAIECDVTGRPINSNNNSENGD